MGVTPGKQPLVEGSCFLLLIGISAKEKGAFKEASQHDNGYNLSAL